MKALRGFSRALEAQNFFGADVVARRHNESEQRRGHVHRPTETKYFLFSITLSLVEISNQYFSCRRGVSLLCGCLVEILGSFEPALVSAFDFPVSVTPPEHRLSVLVGPQAARRDQRPLHGGRY